MLRRLVSWLWRRHRRHHRTALAICFIALGLLLLLRRALLQPKSDNEPLANLPAEDSLVALGSEPPPAGTDEVAVVVLASSRPEVQLLLRQLSASRPPGFRILVSQDGTERRTAQVLSQLGHDVATSLRFFSAAASQDDSYARISRHHMHILDYVFLHLNFRYAVVMEDDLVISPDFFSYFWTLRTVLDQDPSVFCVSAWNDNGLTGLVIDEPTMLHRTDFFPGLGWMISRSRWSSIRSRWPDRQYDDFVRKFMLTEGLVCVRPEISRTFNTGRCGGRKLFAYDAYGRTFYQNYLSRMVLNHHNVVIPNTSISRIIGQSADKELQQTVRQGPEIKLTSLMTSNQRDLPPTARVTYRTAHEFVEIAQQIGIIPEVWFGCPRSARFGIVPISIRGCRVYIAPESQLPLSDDIVSIADAMNKQIPLAIWGISLLSFGCILALLNLCIR